MDQLTSPKIFRSCILFEYFRGKSVYETYKNFCEVMGYESIKYKELEIWYHRFSQGEFNLDYDIESNTSDLEFSSLPNDAIEKIIEKCDLKSQLTLRKVSKDLRSLVDKQKLAYKSIFMLLGGYYVLCAYNGKKVVYADEDWDKRDLEEENCYKYEKSCIESEDYDILRSEDYDEVALNDLSIALKNPKLRLDDLQLTIGWLCSDEQTRYRLESLLKHLNHQIHVETVRLREGPLEYLPLILRCLKPKVLVNIEINDATECADCGEENASNTNEEITSLEQWKQAEQLTTGLYDGFDSEYQMHFKRFVILNVENVSEQFLINLRDIYSESTNFEKCTMRKVSNLHDASRYLESFCEKAKSEDPNILFYNYNIPNSDEYLKFKVVFDRKKLIITKKSYI